MNTLTVRDQAEADALIPAWLAKPASERELRLVLRGPIDLTDHDARPNYFRDWIHDPSKTGMESMELVQTIHRVVVAGETGPDARPLHPDWVRAVRDACREAGTDFHFQSWGDWTPIGQIKECGPGGWDALYKSNRKAKAGEDQRHIDGIYGRDCTVPTRAVDYRGEDTYQVIDGHPGYMTFRVGARRSGRTLDGREWPAKEGS